jgi:hypothetical protein
LGAPCAGFARGVLETPLSAALSRPGTGLTIKSDLPAVSQAAEKDQRGVIPNDGVFAFFRNFFDRAVIDPKSTRLQPLS